MTFRIIQSLRSKLDVKKATKLFFILKFDFDTPDEKIMSVKIETVRLR